MNRQPSHPPRAARVLAALGLAGALCVTAANTATAQSSAAQTGLVGSWIVQVTIRDCATNAPRGSFTSLVTFHRGGTISETAGSPAFAIGQRSEGHGSWAHLGSATYSQQMIALIMFDTPANPPTPAFFRGLQTISHTAELTDPNHFTSSGTNAFYNANGEVYSIGCSSAIGTRFQ